MFSDSARKYSQIFLEPIARFISYTGIAPNVITFLGFVLMMGVAVVLAFGHLFWGGILIIGVVLFDAIDGIMARMMGRTSRFGAFLDSTLDRFSEAVIYLGLFIHFNDKPNHNIELVLIFLTVVGSLMVSYARARAEGIGVTLTDGFFTRFERVFLLVTGLILSRIHGVLFFAALILLAVFSNLTAIQRMYLVWRITGGEKGG